MNYFNNISERVIAVIIAVILIAVVVTAWAAFKSVDAGQVAMIGIIAFAVVVFGINQLLENDTNATSAPVLDGGPWSDRGLRTAEDILKLGQAQGERNEAEAVYRRCNEA
ncbi:MAG TPA: hypothetical protein QGI07_07950 [Dehalococcoidia bacterium]|jgi:hypothetical protein|nr:hypothetical protein [Chloroflexota bacterium]MDP6273745.1 hypothetical protein [Dehalococcoidia bacterium]MDP7160238.1 hypothetical protein [Dehalococcoidia bacterium]MDP7214249.1 hypothetical protein [Dehalococcoidia bacterium]MDP7514142.1 hypothetical protein [Dehalococcoidia bacterium]|tara:strand:+ start:2905 stop:3234 length:330 start_codon:yes stop_codon:yes gene_type:complete